MGCDIHVVVERKYNGKWVGLKELVGVFKKERQNNGEWSMSYIAHPGRTRNYNRFAALAGVRGSGPEAKGLPGDASDLVRMLYPPDHGDYHSHSWCSLHDAAEIFLSSEYDQANMHLVAGDPRRDDPYQYYFDVEGWGYDEDFKVEDYRIVFCFDN